MRNSTLELKITSVFLPVPQGPLILVNPTFTFDSFFEGENITIGCNECLYFIDDPTVPEYNLTCKEDGMWSQNITGNTKKLIYLLIFWVLRATVNFCRVNLNKCKIPGKITLLEIADPVELNISKGGFFYFYIFSYA